jgi:formate dehydrogenase accessory protein FdhD
MATVYHRLVSLEEAVRRIENALCGIAPREVVEMDVADALGYVAAEDVYVKTSSPPFDRSSVDGYAVIASDTYSATENTPVKLKVVGKAAVGKLPETSISEGECVEISTGSPVPRGATAVVMVEYTKRLDEGHVLILKPVSPGENIAHTGSDLSVGDIALRRNQPITSREVAVLIAVGCERVKVYKKPAVTVFSTGDELTPVGKNLEEGRIYDVNGPAITAMLRELGFKATFMGILPDDYEAMRRALGDALKSSDVVITSGSTSAGFGDMIYKVFNELTEGNVIVHGLKLKPGKPTAIAVKDGKILFGLPGFPLSAMMVFLSLVKPVLLRLTGVLDVDAKAVNARMALRVEAGRGKHELLPVVVVEEVNRADVRERLTRRRKEKIVTSSCGSVEDYVNALNSISGPWVASEKRVDAERLGRMVGLSAKVSKGFRNSIAVHTAFLYSVERDNVRYVAEDVSRHVTVDKVIGMAALDRADFSDLVLFTTGRQASDMVFKAARVGIPITVSLRGPLYSGVYTAFKTGVTLVAITRGKGLTVYTHPERIVFRKQVQPPP